MNDSAELSCETLITPRLWRQPKRAEMIGKVRCNLDHALRSKGVRTVIQHEPFFVKRHRSDYDPHQWIPAYWHLQAQGVSLCLLYGHSPFEEPERSFMCGRCKTIVDQMAYEAFAGAPS